MTMTQYEEFLTTKRATVAPSGFDVADEDINPKLFKFQRDIVRWALRLGKAALFENVGLGKTFQQLEYARLVAQYTGSKVLILAPLGVTAQTVVEGGKLGITVKRVFEQADIADTDTIVITNYERVHLFDFSVFAGVVLDESSILKHYSKTFFKLVELCEGIPYRLCCTATPAPNDWVELGNHAMFLGVMHFKDMLARWFVGEGDLARSARLKNYAADDFWRWLTSWSVCITRPADLGEQYVMDGYDLPDLHFHEHRLSFSDASIQRAWATGRLMPDTKPSATEFQAVKRDTLSIRVDEVASIIDGIPADEPIIVWCQTNIEADALKTALKDCNIVEVRGNHTAEQKESALLGFSNGDYRIIVTKPSIAGHGLNWQHCAHMIFAGVDYSFELAYQALGRIHRYGQTREVNAHFVFSEAEGDVMATMQGKQYQHEIMQDAMALAMRQHGLFRDSSNVTVYAPSDRRVETGNNWTYHLGDCVEVMRDMPDDNIDLTVTSIPFSNLYIYSDKEADVGNAADKHEFFEHMKYVIEENYRITRPGRCCAVHVKDLPLFQNRDGEMGVDPFSDDVSAAYRRAGWVLQSRVTIEKDPVIEMNKTNSHGLLYKNWRQRAELLRVGLPDYVLIFQKPGDVRETRVTHDPLDLEYHGDNPPANYRYPHLPTRGKGKVNLSLPIWQNYANPVWDDVVVPLEWTGLTNGIDPFVWCDIVQTEVLNYQVAKDNKDERHICPLQTDLIGRVIHWKSNKSDTVFDPFGGIASTGYQALKMDRKFIGAELKDSYHTLGMKYLREIEQQKAQRTLWDLLDNAEVVS